MSSCSNPAVNFMAKPTARSDGLWQQGGFLNLFLAQSFGAFNDNLYKMVVSLLLIGTVVGDVSGSRYLSLTTAVFMVPYLLFSDIAGKLVDRFNKCRVLIAAKAAEVLVAALALLALLAQRADFLLAVLFLFTAQATFFSPAKYALLPEIMPDALLVRANGLLEMGRYLGIILGTVAGGGALWLWRDQPGWIGGLLIAVAVAGYLVSLWIVSPWRRDSATTVRRGPAQNLWHRVRWLSCHAILGPTVVALVFFDFLSALSMLDLLLLAKQAMALDDLQTSLLGGFAGCGIALGSLIAGRLAEGRLGPVLPTFGAAGIGLAFLLAGNGTDHYGVMALAATLTGLFGGLYLVPLLALLQRSSPPDRRGTILATYNLFGMAGVLIASGVLWLLCDGLGLLASRVMVLCGVVTLAAALTILFWTPAAFRLALRRSGAGNTAQHRGASP